MASQYFSLFSAPLLVFNDGSQSCTVDLQAVNAQQTLVYTGKTGEGMHAEMHAVYQFLKAIDFDVQTFKAYTLSLNCDHKSVCKRCAEVMGALGITAGPKTYKANQTMGSTQWCVPPAFRTFLVQAGLSNAAVNTLCGLYAG